MKTAVKLIWIGFLLTVLWMVSACGSQKPLVETKTVTETITETVRDTVLIVEADSSYYEAYIKCVNNTPVLVPPKTPESKTKPGKHLQEPTVQLNDSTLTVMCQTKAQELYLQWVEKYKETHTDTKTPVLVERELTWWQTLWITLGKFCLLLLVAIVVYVVFKLIK